MMKYTYRWLELLTRVSVLKFTDDGKYKKKIGKW